MKEVRSVEAQDRKKRLLLGGAATVVVGFAFGFGITDYNAHQNEIRDWLQDRGIPGCDATTGETPCVTDVGQTDTWAEIIRPNAGSIVVQCFFSDSPMAPEPGCYVDLPGGFDNPNDVLITGPETVLQA